MSPLQYVLVMAAIAVVAVGAMLLGWRARFRQNRDLVTDVEELTGELIDHLEEVSYVSTTAVGAPFERIALKGLTYRGKADLEIRTDGVRITVTGEPTFTIPGDRVQGFAEAAARAGKAVESGGLSLLVWRSLNADEQLLETTFRFAGVHIRDRFESAITRLVDMTSDAAADNHSI
ncbi:hypothetical protein ICL81_10445 [Leucobacter sp. cx-328]|uniref:PH-like domain-containing protein n=1 Tax=unclassified Leucobacter TaxID=2621730 RepID=UPI00165D752B|nr:MULTISPECIES: hypothetical protein [unclassified Leucobacter]MBC9944924.1 hypothetical protein [Leucobacter sp. cx-328]